MNYFKHTNTSEDKWADLIGLTQKLAKGHSVTATYATSYDADFVTAIQSAVDVNQWMRFMAVSTMADNSETNISNGDGDDYYMYFGVTDPRVNLITYDLDTILGSSATSNSATHNLFRMCREDFSPNAPAPIHPLMSRPEFARVYFQELKRLLDGLFSAAQLDQTVDETLGGLVDATTIANIKAFNVSRTAYVASQLPFSLSGIAAQTTGGVALTITSGYPRSTVATCNLTGKADCRSTASVKVDGVAATYSPWKVTTVAPFATSVGDWTATNVALTPGLNRLLIQTFDSNNAELERTNFDVWFDGGAATSVSGAIAVNTTWTPAGGPYQVTANLTVNSGVTLTIQPGTSVYLASGVNLIVANGGKTLAEGTETQPVRFTRAPGAAASWGNLQINGGAGSPETRIAYAHFEFNGGSPCILCTNATVYLDHLTFGNTAVSYIHLDDSSFIVSNCIFPNATAQFEGVHGTGGVKAGGHGIVRGCFFGLPIGYNDVFDFTGGSRPGTALIQFYNNVFTGASDDMLDLDGTDAWVEGNIFLHSHKNGSPDTSSAVSGGEDQGATANKSEITMIGNIFYDCDCAITAKEGNFYTMINNTIVHQTRTGGTESRAGVVNLADDGIAQGVGTYLEGNIIYDIEALERSYSPPLTSVITFNNNILPFAWSGPGSGNSIVDPRFNRIPVVAETNFTTFKQAQIMREWFSLLPGSPALGTGPNGRDKGAVNARGASIGGAPSGTTNLTAATLTVGSNAAGFSIPTTPWPNGSGFTHYKWKLDAGAFSAETPIATPISIAGLANGTHIVSVVGKNDVGLYQNDAMLGTDATVTTKTWIVDTTYVPPPSPTVIINEVLAKNTETTGFSGVFPDIIELYNAGNATAVLDGWGLTDNNALPYKYTIPNGTTLAAGAYLTIYASNAASVPTPKTGFGLKDTGDTLTLTKSVAAGGTVADAVPFGAQIADVSVGRRPSDGAWDMCRPTFGAVNIVAAQSNLIDLKINEWLADAVTLIGQDFVELYNPNTLPVNIGACYLSDNPVEYPTRHQIRQLTFLAAGGYTFFKADDDVNQGPDHLNFKLDALQGEIGFFSPAQLLLDNVVYGPQSSDVSEGRTPNGADTVAFFNQPTPGAPNPGTTGNSSTTTNIIPATQGWRYHQNATVAPSNDSFARLWTNPAYSDTEASLGWLPASGVSGQVLYIESSALSAAGLAEGFAKTTLLTGFNTTHPYQTYYFRTHFNYSGSLTNVTLSAEVFCDDGAVIYLNGFEAGRVRVTANPVIFSTEASLAPDVTMETISIDPTHLQAGDNVLAVSVHQSGTQSATAGSSDVTWGMKLDATVTVAGGASPIVLNEVFPVNATLQNPDGSFVGWIELYNTSGTAVDISDMSLSNDVSDPRKYVIPASTAIAANSYRVIFCNSLTAASATNTGFALTGNGGGVFFFRKLSEGGGLKDSVSYGLQVPDFSLGRSPNGSGVFALNLPTRGALNTAAGLGTITSVKFNEWLVNPTVPPGWFEIFNTGAQPILIGGNYFTDNLTNRTKFLVPPLTFIGGNGGSRWQQWFADNNNTATPAHVNFTLAASQNLGLFSASGVQLDARATGSPGFGISQGLYPDGTGSVRALAPSPAAANTLPALDTDGDGIPDDWEIANGLNPNDPLDAALDRDSDGQTNLAEYRAGTNPNDPLSVFVGSIARVAGQTVIRFTAAANKAYTIQFKNTMLDIAWQKLTDIAGDPAVRSLEIPDPAPGFPTRFYRVVTPMQ